MTNIFLEPWKLEISKSARDDSVDRLECKEELEYVTKYLNMCTCIRTSLLLFNLSKLISRIALCSNICFYIDLCSILQVETFGSMEKKEKVEFILEQMRLCLAKKDFIRTSIISKKINTRFFDDADTTVGFILWKDPCQTTLLININIFSHLPIVCCWYFKLFTCSAPDKQRICVYYTI